MKKLSIFSFLLMVILLVFACSDETLPEINIEPDAPENPFDGVDYGGNDMPGVEIDPTSFLGLHNDIFSQSCNQPACHDGTFEPDFRTVQSSYNSLVLHPITKNYNPNVDGQNPLPFRVTPGSPDQSMMWHRLTIHNPPNFERMPSSGVPLSNDKIDLIEDWIANGAKDIFGNDPMPTSRQPLGFGVVAYLNDFRIDTIRPGNQFNSFQTLVDQEIDIWFGIIDYGLNGEIIFGDNLTYNKVQFSTNPFDFSDAIEMDLEVSETPRIVNSVFSQENEDFLPYYQTVTINPTSMGFQPGERVYMRSFVQDADHDEPTENPKDDSQFVIQLYYSFQMN